MQMPRIIIVVWQHNPSARLETPLVQSVDAQTVWLPSARKPTLLEAIDRPLTGA